MKLSIVEFSIKIQKEFGTSIEFFEEQLYEGIFKIHLKVIINSENFVWFGIGITEREAKESAVCKSCNYFNW